MNYCLAKDLPAEFFPEKKAATTESKTKRKAPQLKETQQLVWDLDNKGFRIISDDKIEGSPVKRTVELKELLDIAPEGNKLKQLLEKKA